MRDTDDTESDSSENDRKRVKREKGILHGKSIHIIDINIPRAKLKILQNIVQKNGGIITDSPDINNNTTILADFDSIEACKESFASSRLRKKFAFTEEQCERMTRLEWLTMSVKDGSCLPFDKFLLKKSTMANNDNDDDDDNDNNNNSNSDDSDNNSDRNESVLAPGYVNDGWACRHACPLDHPNKDICHSLSLIMKHRRITGDARSELSYAKAIAILAGYPRRIGSAAEAAAIKGIGPKIASLISEFITTGHIAVVQEHDNDRHYQLVKALCDVHGVGGKTADRWVSSMGVDSVEKARSLVDSGELKVSEQQRLGLLYYDDMRKKMSRQQVEHIHKLVQSVLPAECEFYPTGGYRRGKPFSNDVDILIVSTDVNILDLIMSRLDVHVVGVLQLTRSARPGPVHPKPANPGSFDHLGKCLMLLKAPDDDAVRRVDIIHVPCREMLPWAQLGWTGSRQFERSIRLYADRVRRVHLSSDGAFCQQSMAYLTADSEEQCFAVLGLPFIAPEDRNC